VAERASASLRLRLHDLAALLGVGRKLGARAGLLRPCDGGGTARLVESCRAEKPLATSDCVRCRSACAAASTESACATAARAATPPGAAQPRQAGSGLALAGLRLRQRSPQFVAFQADQDFTLPDLRAFVHRHLSTRPVSVLPTSTREKVATRAENCSVRTSGRSAGSPPAQSARG
jgi:hypothetical protein